MPYPHANRAGFTLMELMIVVSIIGLLAIIAFPSFVTARQKSQRNVCINNLRQINHAKDRYALDRLGTAPSTVSQLVPTYINRTPSCPAKGTYNVRPLGTDPTCSRSTSDGHTI